MSDNAKGWLIAILIIVGILVWAHYSSSPDGQPAEDQCVSQGPYQYGEGC